MVQIHSEGVRGSFLTMTIEDTTLGELLDYVDQLTTLELLGEPRRGEDAATYAALATTVRLAFRSTLAAFQRRGLAGAEAPAADASVAEQLAWFLRKAMDADPPSTVRVTMRDGRVIIGEVSRIDPRRCTVLPVWIAEPSGRRFCRPVVFDQGRPSACDIIEACVVPRLVVVSEEQDA